MKRKLRKQFHLEQNKIKKNTYLGINLTKEVKDLYTENYKTPLKEITNTRKDISCSQTGKLNMLRCQYYPKQSTGSMKSLLKFQWHFCFAEIENTS